MPFLLPETCSASAASTPDIVSVGCFVGPARERLESPFRKTTTVSGGAFCARFSQAPFPLVHVIGLPVIRFHDIHGKNGKTWGFSYNPVAMTASGFTRDSSGHHLGTRPPGHHMQSARGSLSGPGLGSGWSLLPHPHRRQQAPRRCGWGSGTGVWDGGLGRGTGQPCDQPARRGTMVRGSDGGSRQFVSSSPDVCFGGGSCRVRDGNWHQ